MKKALILLIASLLIGFTDADAKRRVNPFGIPTSRERVIYKKGGICITVKMYNPTIVIAEFTITGAKLDGYDIDLDYGGYTSGDKCDGVVTLTNGDRYDAAGDTSPAKRKVRVRCSLDMADIDNFISSPPSRIYIEGLSDSLLYDLSPSKVGAALRSCYKEVR